MVSSLKRKAARNEKRKEGIKKLAEVIRQKINKNRLINTMTSSSLDVQIELYNMIAKKPSQYISPSIVQKEGLVYSFVRYVNNFRKNNSKTQKT